MYVFQLAPHTKVMRLQLGHTYSVTQSFCDTNIFILFICTLISLRK
jgi:hypothetical protein